jgi:osmotically inducible protein OsmC
MADIQRTGEAVWTGNLRDGRGHLSSESGALDKESYSFGTRFKHEPGTNPEELIAAAHAGCYSMALAAELASNGYRPERIETHATCTLVPQEGGGFRITRMELQVRVQVPGLDGEKLGPIADEADKGCPVSNLLRSGLQIELDVSLK